MDFTVEWEWFFSVRGKGIPSDLPAGAGESVRSLSQGREQWVGQFQLHFPFDDGKTRNRMEFPVNSSSPCKLSINKYSGLDPNRECREGGEGTEILIRGFHLTFIENHIWTNTKVYQNWFLSKPALSHSAFCENFSLNLGKLSTRLAKGRVQHLGHVPKSQRNPGMSQAGAAGTAKLLPKSCRGTELCQRHPGSAGLGLVWNTWKWDEYGQIWTKIHTLEFVRVGITLAGWGPTALVINPWNYPFVPWNFPDVHKTVLVLKQKANPVCFQVQINSFSWT